jgi:gamma-glutamyltranspeptidase/glutathione hydrolase
LLWKNEWESSFKGSFHMLSTIFGLISSILLISISSCSALKKSFDETNQDKLILVPSVRPEETYNSTPGLNQNKSSNVMIASEHPLATEIGLGIIKKGGNIFDAAVSISFALSVLRPQSTGIGGGGFMLFFTPNMADPLSLDFREKAPIKAFQDMFLNSKGEPVSSRSINNIWAAAVPGLVAGLMEVHEKYGKLPLPVVMAPAIDLANYGFQVGKELALALAENRNTLLLNKEAKKIFIKGNDENYKEADTLIQLDLGNTLKIIAKEGRNGFYKGQIANKILEEQKRLGGLITQKDLNSYFPKYRKPIKGTYKDFFVYSMAPPSSGGAHIVQILNILEKFELSKKGIHSAQTIHLTASAMQLAFADRAKYLGDTDFVDVPLKGLISKNYAHELAQKIPLTKALSQADVYPGNPLPFESDETNHFTIMDKNGNTISSTQSINGNFGSGVVVPGTGIILNSQMDDFTSKLGEQNHYGAVGGVNNLIAPQKRPLSSMSPTIIFSSNKTPVLALGTAAGTRILTCVTQTILNFIEFKLSLFESVMALRYHHQWYPDEILIEAPMLPANITQKLTGLGHKLRYQDLGCRVQAVSLEKGILEGVSDPRGLGQAKGY